ncbi:MAG TPA: ABC transporter permease [Vicinamibacterales bacterium]|nr:ABC transporter permease [Vicinamibacterales bacterium]
MSHIMAIASDLVGLWRRWRARPALPGLALLVLVIGVGAGTTVLGVTYAALLRPLPYPSADRLVLVRSEFPGMKLTGMGLSGPEASELAGLATSLSAVGLGYRSSAIVTIDAEPVRGDVVAASAGFLRALAAKPDEGRVFTADEDAPGGPCRAVVSRSFRDRSLGADGNAVGRTIRVDDRLCEIVGVWPSRVDFVGVPADVWVPLHYDVRSPTSNRANHAFTVVARLAPGQSLESARADVARAVDGWMTATGQMHSPSPKFHPLAITPLVDGIRGPVRSTALVLLLSVVAVLAITIANASALLVADVDRRRTELIVRAALGADRRRLWQMHAVEAGALSAMAGLLGAIVALVGANGVAALAPPALANLELSLPIWQSAAIAGAIAAAAALVCSLFQASRLPWHRLGSALADDGRTGTASGSRQRLRAWLVGTEIVLAVSLFAGATLMIETVWRLSTIDLGFRPEGVIRAQINLPSDGYDTRARIDGFYDAVADMVRARGDVLAVGAVTGLLPERRPNNTSITINGATGPAADPHLGLPPIQFVQYLTPDAFAALGLELRRGRLFTPGDSAGSQRVVIVNERAAATYFAGRDALGGQLRPMGPGFEWLTVVGIVADARQNGVVREPGTEMFVPLAQADSALGRGSFTRNLNVVARVRDGDPAALGPVLRDAVRAIDAAAAISEIETLGDVVARGVGGQRFLMFVLTGFAAVAIALATIGVYGVIAHAVALRRREIGVRRSLGASHWAVARLVGRQVTSLVIGGLVVGTGVAIAGTRLLAPFVYQADIANPARSAAAGAAIAILALLATARPLQRALQVDPAVVLRD